MSVTSLFPKKTKIRRDPEIPYASITIFSLERLAQQGVIDQDRPIKRIIRGKILAALAKYALENPDENEIHVVLVDGQIVLSQMRGEALAAT